MTKPRAQSSLLDYLPAIYREDPFLGGFLMAFEKVLIGIDDGVAVPDPEEVVPFPRGGDEKGLGLEKSIADIARYFDPSATPEEFLPWLADWTAFTMRSDLDPKKQRDFIANIVPLYQKRGTKQNLQELLKIFTVGNPEIIEAGDNAEPAGRPSPPCSFQVTIALPRAAPRVQQRQIAIARALIELEAPAHTSYTLKVNFPSMVIGEYSTVGVDTLIGTR